jgi:cytochrome c oxidase subunit 4
MTTTHDTHIIPVRTYMVIWAVLMGLLVLTVSAAFVKAFGHLAIVVAMVIAVVKAALVVLYFMHVRYSSRLTQIFVTATLVWLAILFALSFSDYFTRSWMTMSEGWNQQAQTPPVEAPSAPASH